MSIVFLAQDSHTRDLPSGLDVQQLLRTGALTGPYTRPHPYTLTWRTRLVRALRHALRAHNLKVN